MASVKHVELKELPPAIKASLGIGRSRAKVLQRDDGQLIARAVQDIGQVVVVFTSIKGEKARHFEITEDELHRVLLMARDVKKLSGSQDDVDLEED